MTTYRAGLLTMPPSQLKAGARLLQAAVGVILLSWLIFSALVSTLDLMDSSKAGYAFWHIASIVLLLAVAVFVIRGLLHPAWTGTPLIASSIRRGPDSPPGRAPMAGAPCPVPIHPTPHLISSAAKRLPFEKSKNIDAISN
jgi:hypothetical protein